MSSLSASSPSSAAARPPPPGAARHWPGRRRASAPGSRCWRPRHGRACRAAATPPRPSAAPAAPGPVVPAAGRVPAPRPATRRGAARRRRCGGRPPCRAGRCPRAAHPALPPADDGASSPLPAGRGRRDGWGSRYGRTWRPGLWPPDAPHASAPGHVPSGQRHTPRRSRRPSASCRMPCSGGRSCSWRCSACCCGCRASSPCRRRTATRPASPRPAGRWWRAATTSASASARRSATRSRPASTGCRRPRCICWKRRGWATATHIWAYRVPSLLGALLAVLATFHWGRGLVGRRAALLGAAMLASSLVLVAEAHIAKTDAALLATIVGAMGLFGQAYLRPEAFSARQAAAFWLLLGLGVLLKGPIGPMVPLLAGITLAVSDKARTLVPGVAARLGRAADGRRRGALVHRHRHRHRGPLLRTGRGRRHAVQDRLRRGEALGPARLLPAELRHRRLPRRLDRALRPAHRLAGEAASADALPAGLGGAVLAGVRGGADQAAALYPAALPRADAARRRLGDGPGAAAAPPLVALGGGRRPGGRLGRAGRRRAGRALVPRTPPAAGRAAAAAGAGGAGLPAAAHRTPARMGPGRAARRIAGGAGLCPGAGRRGAAPGAALGRPAAGRGAGGAGARPAGPDNSASPAIRNLRCCLHLARMSDLLRTGGDAAQFLSDGPGRVVAVGNRAEADFRNRQQRSISHHRRSPA